MKNVLRWILFFPVALIGARVLEVIATKMLPIPFINRLVPAFVAAYSFFKISAYIIPKNNNKIAAILSLILLSIGMLFVLCLTLKSVHDLLHPWNFILLLSLPTIIAGVVAFYIIYKEKDR